jgi:hypothetical protein
MLLPVAMKVHLLSFSIEKKINLGDGNRLTFSRLSGIFDTFRDYV